MLWTFLSWPTIHVTKNGMASVSRRDYCCCKEFLVGQEGLPPLFLRSLVHKCHSYAANHKSTWDAMVCYCKKWPLCLLALVIIKLSSMAISNKKRFISFLSSNKQVTGSVWEPTTAQKPLHFKSFCEFSVYFCTMITIISKFFPRRPRNLTWEKKNVLFPARLRPRGFY